MEYPNCKIFGFNQEKISKTLTLFEINEQDYSLIQKLHSDVIAPCLNEIIDAFYLYLTAHEDYSQLLEPGEKMTRLVKTQEKYLLSLGINMTSREYVEGRLRIGIAHNRIGLSPALYECAYTKLNSLISERIPQKLEDETRSRMHVVLKRIISFDISLALESYYHSNVQVLHDSIDKLKEETGKLSIQSNTDSLTGIYNRSAILGLIARSISKYQIDRKKFSIVMCDIQNIREVNLRFGHMAGDVALKVSAQLLEEKIGTLGCTGRYGGNEFLILLPGYDEKQARKISMGLLRFLSTRSITIREKKLPVTLVAGITEVRNEDDLPALLWRVDRNLMEKPLKTASPNSTGDQKHIQLAP